MGQFVVVAYRPKQGKGEDLAACVRDHLSVLRGEGLATDFPPLVLRAADGTLVEIFEWESADAIARAHENPRVRELWERFGACCDYVPVAEVPEAQRMFSEFQRFPL